jgi:hypothetical protein
MENFDFGWIPGFALDKEGAIAGADYVIAVNDCVSRFHLQFAPGGNSSRQRATHPDVTPISHPGMTRVRG